MTVIETFARFPVGSLPFSYWVLGFSVHSELPALSGLGVLHIFSLTLWLGLFLPQGLSIAVQTLSPRKPRRGPP